ncbi:uncharacterized protein METZ01_LOCUS214461, partial [marine metagenome]
MKIANFPHEDSREMKEIKTFQQMYRDGHVNRREFLAAMGALGVTAAT